MPMHKISYGACVRIIIMNSKCSVICFCDHVYILFQHIDIFGLQVDSLNMLSICSVLSSIEQAQVHQIW